ncbi:MAG: hypothetical protein CL878_12610 [Dehalococcoidia bacterium]|nr:hypothetical protein [Dehalococcoidia bacterium]
MKPRRWLLRTVCCGLATSALGTYAWPKLALAQSEVSTGTIRGRVLHGTSGAVQTAIEVRLWNLDASIRSRRVVQTAVTDSDGGYEFAGLGLAAADLYQPVVTFGEVEYVGPVVRAIGEQATRVQRAADGEPAIGASDVRVFDVTHDPSQVRLARTSLILAQVNAATGEVSLIQTIIVSNDGPQTYVAQPVTASPVRMAPPVGAAGVAPLTGVQHEDLVVTSDGGLVPAVPMAPGETPLTMGYSLTYAGPRLSVTIPILQPIGQLRVLVPASGIQVESDDLRPFGAAAVGGNRFTAVGTTDLIPGTQVTFTIGGLPHAAKLAIWGGRRPLQVGIAAAAAAVLATLGVLALADPHARRRDEPVPADEESERLVADIRELADKEDPTSQLERRARKARLLALTGGVPSADGSRPRPAAADEAVGDNGAEGASHAGHAVGPER